MTFNEINLLVTKVAKLIYNLQSYNICIVLKNAIMDMLLVDRNYEFYPKENYFSITNNLRDEKQYTFVICIQLSKDAYIFDEVYFIFL